MKVLESPKLRLVPVEEKHLQFLLDLRNEQQICDWIVHDIITYDQQLKWFNNLKNAQLFVIIIPGNIPVGTIGLFDINTKHQRAKWNLRIHPDHWRNGYAKEAIKLFLDYIFNVMNINKLMADCFADNIPEVTNLRKQGFREEGVWKEHYFHKGKFRDSIQFVMLKSEYENR